MSPASVSETPGLDGALDENTPLVAVEAITKRFGGNVALRDVSLSVRRGEILALTGENGAGKSTLIKILAGVHQPDSGCVYVEGDVARLKHPTDAHGYGFGFLHQQLDLVGSLSVRENLLLGRPYPRTASRRIDWAAVDAAARRALDEVGLQIDVEEPVAALTLAQQQLVALARMLMADPQFIVLDEPTASLGPEDTEHLLELVRARREAGRTTIFISHRLEEVMRLADRVTVLRDGAVVATVDRADLTRHKLVVMLGGSEEMRVHSSAGPRETKPRLEVEALGGPGLDRSATLTVYAGEVVGLAGLVGAGRTTLAKMLVGIDPVSSGSIKIDGEISRINNPRSAARRGLVLVSDDRGQALVPSFPIQHNISLGHLDDYTRAGVLIDHGRERDVATSLAKKLNVKAATVMTETWQLSGGNQQKVLLARALDLDPSILILDEPTHGVDIATKQYLYQLIRDIADQGLAVLLISSELEELPIMSDRILTMHRGEIRAELPRTATRADIVAELFAEVADD
jgi:ABC-type sugar transport system ATPase subunit